MAPRRQHVLRCLRPPDWEVALQGDISVSEFTDKLAAQIQGVPDRLQAALDKASQQLEASTAAGGGQDKPAGQDTGAAGAEQQEKSA